MGKHKTIRIHGARQNNLKNLSLEIPHRQWLAICGPSGSGKSSLAVQTLYAEGQRRYVESFSPYTRQFLDQAEKPSADSIESVPAAVVVNSTVNRFGRRTTIGSITEVLDFFRLLFSRLADVHCPDCGVKVTADHPPVVSASLQDLTADSRFMIGFSIGDWWVADAGKSLENDVDLLFASLRESGFARVIVNGQSVGLTGEVSLPERIVSSNGFVVVDRLVAGRGEPGRIVESIETAMRFGNGKCVVWAGPEAGLSEQTLVEVDGQAWGLARFSNNLDCPRCDRRLRSPEPAALSSTSPLGACPKCEGFGDLPEFSMELIVPNASLSIREGAIAPWNAPSYKHELEEMLAIGDEYRVRLDVPFSELTSSETDLIWKGVREKKFGGLNGFFRWLERRKYKLHHRVFLSRWRKWKLCDACDGSKLNPSALSFRIDETNLAQLLAMPIDETLEFVRSLGEKTEGATIARPVVEQVARRLEFLQQSGLGQLSLDRKMTTISTGQAQRVMLACSLGSNLVNMLYVLDEPSDGLHPHNVSQVLPAIRRLHQMPNTVVVVDHSELLLNEAERVVELGPGSGDLGGEIVFDGTTSDLAVAETPTGFHISGRKGGSFSRDSRRSGRGRLVVKNAQGRNLKGIDVEFPLGCLCVVTGVSGAGKSTLVRDTLWPLLMSSRSNDASSTTLSNDGLGGADSIEEVEWIDSSPPNRTARSIPATYIKVFDEIRKLFAATPEAKARNLKAGSFSFNVAGGRCEKCQGEGRLAIDMQFLADISMECDQCHGRRYQPGPLEAKYRGKNIDEVLRMTSAQSFGFFRGQPKIQGGLKSLKDAGLDYLRLGQSLATLSRGETQRLKLAAKLGSNTRRRTLYLLDSPTSGLHMDDVTRLVDCFGSLLEVGHSLIVVDHSLQLMSHADWIIDLGPGADEEGGRVVVAGKPEQVVECDESVTGKYLRRYLERFELTGGEVGKVRQRKK